MAIWKLFLWSKNVQQHHSKSGFSNFLTFNIWDWIILCWVGLAEGSGKSSMHCRMYSHIPSLSPPDVSSTPNQLWQPRVPPNNHLRLGITIWKMTTVFIAKCWSKPKHRNIYKWTTVRDKLQWYQKSASHSMDTHLPDAVKSASWSQPQEQQLRVRDTWASWMNDLNSSQGTQSIFVFEAAWSSNLIRSDWMALWLLYSSVHLKSLSCLGFLTTLIAQPYQAG